MWLLPSPSTFKNAPLVGTPKRNYTSRDLAEFFEDIGFGEGVERYRRRILPLVEEKVVAPEGVPVTCVVGTGVKTPQMLVYREGGFDQPPEIVYGDGDGTVNLESLLALSSNNDGNGETVKVVEVKGVSHSDVLKDPAALKVITREIEFINSLNSSSVSYLGPHRVSL